LRRVGGGGGDTSHVFTIESSGEGGEVVRRRLELPTSCREGGEAVQRRLEGEANSKCLLIITNLMLKNSNMHQK
jgi:hypothetical protein